jgi:hypothetical protein
MRAAIVNVNNANINNANIDNARIFNANNIYTTRTLLPCCGRLRLGGMAQLRTGDLHTYFFRQLVANFCWQPVVDVTRA